ncbi:M56 family metallopeptidase [Iamia majanohamensis]|uniref:M56 family metallopeptidase n=1 Tax=Iamia majanohamensis TaxID=467976 RepID=A0AAF0BWN3_9ACTN|nr:M56 family metallopeptidase [Iamia majanohamensis]WCO68005.1 M56 family metallopeptidase [Iamia majanohamensis]
MAVAPLPAVAVIGCVVAWCLSTGVRAPGWASILVIATVALMAVGAVRALRSGLAQVLATSRLARAVGDHWMVCPPRVAELARRAGLGEVEVVDDDGRYAYTYGLRSPQVVVSRGLTECTDDAQLVAVFAHERHHVAQNDPLKVVLARAVAAATGWVLPAVNHLLDRYLLGRELDADRRAIECCGRPAVAGALLHAVSGPQDVGVGAAAAIAAPHMMEVRLHQLERSTAPVLPTIPVRAVGRTAAGLMAVTTGLTASVMWLGRTAGAGLPMGDGVGAMGGTLICVAMWVLGACALWLHGRGVSLTHPPPSSTTDR